MKQKKYLFRGNSEDSPKKGGSEDVLKNALEVESGVTFNHVLMKNLSEPSIHPLHALPLVVAQLVANLSK